MNEEQKRAMTPEKFAKQMREYNNFDPESGHMAADRLICDLLRDLGYGEGADVFEGMDKWYA